MPQKGFEVGDIVKLRSGGPEMTVESIPDGNFKNFFLCQWFAGKKLESGRFQEESLELVKAISE